MTLRLVHKAPGFRGVDRAPREPAWRALHRAADRRVPALRRAFLGWARSLGANPHWPSEQERLGLLVVPVLRETYMAGARAGERTTRVHKQFRTLIGVFDLLSPRAASWAALHAASLVTNLIEEQRLVLREIVTRAQRQGIGVAVQALEIEERLRFGIGLDRVRAGALQRFIDGQVEAGVAPEVVRRRASDLRDRYLRQRADLIAKHETLTAAAEGRAETWRQARTQGLLPEGTRKRRIVVRDDRLCPICEPMDGQEVAFDEPFTSPTDGSEVMHGPQHVGCRCSEALIIPGIE